MKALIEVALMWGIALAVVLAVFLLNFWMVSGGKTTLCDYYVLFSLVIYQNKTARSDFE